MWTPTTGLMKARPMIEMIVAAEAVQASAGLRGSGALKVHVVDEITHHEKLRATVVRLRVLLIEVDRAVLCIHFRLQEPFMANVLARLIVLAVGIVLARLNRVVVIAFQGQWRQEMFVNRVEMLPWSRLDELIGLNQNDEIWVVMPNVRTAHVLYAMSGQCPIWRCDVNSVDQHRDTRVRRQRSPAEIAWHRHPSSEMASKSTSSIVDRPLRLQGVADVVRRMPQSLTTLDRS